ncbi:hypothetical protein MAR_004702 [Mya arenaria]|uniref:Uncharacterized protein n=1 Tax=Mya arenaria TaxID=6604 RepID=A0ABY7EZ20_MYAAR|nr:hypothetical protein MAR_004702 [Mya arenaria]
MWTENASGNTRQGIPQQQLVWSQRCIEDYQRHMKEVDLIDLIMGYYMSTTDQASNGLVTHHMQITAAHNSYIISQDSNPEAIQREWPKYQDFIEDLVKDLIGNYKASRAAPLSYIEKWHPFLVHNMTFSGDCTGLCCKYLADAVGAASTCWMQLEQQVRVGCSWSSKYVLDAVGDAIGDASMCWMQLEQQVRVGCSWISKYVLDAVGDASTCWMKLEQQLEQQVRVGCSWISKYVLDAVGDASMCWVRLSSKYVLDAVGDASMCWMQLVMQLLMQVRVGYSWSSKYVLDAVGSASTCWMQLVMQVCVGCSWSSKYVLDAVGDAIVDASTCWIQLEQQVRVGCSWISKYVLDAVGDASMCWMQLEQQLLMQVRVGYSWSSKYVLDAVGSASTCWMQLVMQVCVGCSWSSKYVLDAVGDAMQQEIRLMIVAIVAALVLLLTTARAEGCSCHPREPKEVFCNSDYAVVLEVVNVSEPFYSDNMDPGPWSMPWVDYGIEVRMDFK